MLDLPFNNIGTLPGLELQIIQDKILLFLFCSIRISAFLISSPIFGAGYVLLPVRILFAMVLTLSIFQDQSALIDVQTITSPIGIILIAKEIAIGLSAGLVLTFALLANFMLISLSDFFLFIFDRVAGLGYS